MHHSNPFEYGKKRAARFSTQRTIFSVALLRLVRGIRNLTSKPEMLVKAQSNSELLFVDQLCVFPVLFGVGLFERRDVIWVGVKETVC